MREFAAQLRLAPIRMIVERHPQSSLNRPWAVFFIHLVLRVACGMLVRSLCWRTFMRGNFLVVVLASAAILLAGCAVHPINSRSAAEPVRGALVVVGDGLKVRMGGVLDRGRFAGLPQVVSMADYNALTDVVSRFSHEIGEATRRGDVDRAVVLWYAGMPFIEYWTALSASSRVAIRSMLSLDGRLQTRVPVGGYALIPAFDRAYGDPGQQPARSHLGGVLEAIDAHYASALLMPLPLGNGTLVAAAKGASALGGAAPLAPRRGIDVGHLPFRQPVTLESGVVVMRTEDSLVFSGNNASHTLPLSQMNWLPPLRQASPDRVRAAPIIANLIASNNAMLRASIRSQGAVDFYSQVVAPNNVGAVSGPQGRVDETGRLTSDGAAARRSEQAYRARADYRTAVQVASDLTGSSLARSSFAKCKAAVRGTGSMQTTEVTGNDAEIVSYSCFALDGSNQPGTMVYSVQYVLTDGKIMQTAESLLRDRWVRDRLNVFDKTSSSIADIAGVFPVVAGAAGADKCLFSGGASQELYQAYKTLRGGDAGFDLAMAWKPYAAEDVAPAASNAGLASRVSECLSAVPMAGKIGSVASKFAGFSSSGAAAKLDAALALLDSKLRPGMSGKALTNAEAAFGSSIGTGGRVAKGIYDALQRSRTMVEFQQALRSI